MQFRGATVSIYMRVPVLFSKIINRNEDPMSFVSVHLIASARFPIRLLNKLIANWWDKIQRRASVGKILRSIWRKFSGKTYRARLSYSYPNSYYSKLYPTHSLHFVRGRKIIIVPFQLLSENVNHAGITVSKGLELNAENVSRLQTVSSNKDEPCTKLA